MIELKIQKRKKGEGTSVYLAHNDKSEYGPSALEVTNEYGNSQVRNFGQLPLS